MGLYKKFVNQTRKPEGTLGKKMVNGMNSGHAKMADWGMSHLPELNPSKILEAGCGGGRNAGELAKRYEDMFHAFILSMDSFAYGLLKAAQMIEDGRLEDNIKERYSSFDSELGRKVRDGSATLEELAAKASELKAPKAPVSGRQEYLEGVLNNIILSNN